MHAGQWLKINLMAGSVCTMLFVLVAGATIFRHHLATANDTGCNNRSGIRTLKAVQDLECRVSDHINGTLSLKNIFKMVCSLN